MNKKITGIICILIFVLIALSGCGSHTPPSVDTEAVKTDITTAFVLA
ncbi:MAG TPA: hypothetical protein VHY08_16570 [Bacillota bacterium]|nr:hypothetical protein [Bacillota bacterium]